MSEDLFNQVAEKEYNDYIERLSKQFAHVTHVTSKDGREIETFFGDRESIHDERYGALRYQASAHTKPSFYIIID